MNNEIINKKRRELYAQNKEEINEKRKIKREPDPIKKLKDQVVNAIYNSYTRKGIKRTKSIDEILRHSLDEEIEKLLKIYKHTYKKDYDGTEKVQVDHILPIWMAKTETDIDECNRCLQLLKVKDNKRKGGKLSNGIGKNGKVKYTFYYDDDFFE